MVELLFWLIDLLLPGLIATLVTGGGAVSIFGVGLLDDILMIVVRKMFTSAAEFEFPEAVAFAVLWDEVIKGGRAAISDQQDEDEADRIRDHERRYHRGSPLVISGQLDLYDPLLIWWSSRTLLESDAAGNLAGILGVAEFIL